MKVYKINNYDDWDMGLYATKELAEKFLQEEVLNEFPEEEKYYWVEEVEVIGS